MLLNGNNRNISSLGVDAFSWRNAVISNGGSVSSTRATLVANFIRTEKSNGTWGLTDDYWMFWGENSVQALTSLKQRRLATAVNSPTFSTNQHYLFNGTTSYIDTGFIPSSHAVVMSASSTRIGIYARTDVNNGNYDAGVTSSNSRIIRIRTRNSTSALIYTINDSSTFTLPSADSRGFTSGSRIGGLVTDVAAYKNGVAMTRTVDATALGASLPVISLFVGGHNSGGSLSGARASSIGLLVIGAALSASQELAQYNNIQSFATLIGAQV